MFIKADKTKNVSEVNNHTHNKLLTDNTTKTSKENPTTSYLVNEEAIYLPIMFRIENKERLTLRNVFINPKDHKITLRKTLAVNE